jgi:hypothetical protein
MTASHSADRPRQPPILSRAALSPCNNWLGTNSKICLSSQASAFAYFDIFWMIAVLTFAATFLVLVMKRSVAQKGSHASSE